MDKLKKDLIGGICLLIYGILYFTFSFQIKITSVKTVSARFLPQIVSGGICALSAILIFRTISAMRAYKALHPEELTEDKDGRALRRIQIRQIFIEIAILAVTVLWMKRLGFIIASFLFLMASFFFFFLREKWNPVQYLLLSVIIPTVLYFVFLRLFNVILPGGLLKFLM